MIALSELNEDVLGEDGFHAAAADCHVRTGEIKVDLFEGGDSFKTFAVRMQTRCALAPASTSRHCLPTLTLVLSPPVRSWHDGALERIL